MDRQGFIALLSESVTTLLKGAGLTNLDPEDVPYELHAFGHAGKRFRFEELDEWLFIDEERFYAIIDLAVRKDRGVSIFVRISGHQPGAWDETWNNPPGSGPFKLLGPMPSA